MGNTDMTAYMAAGEFSNLGQYKGSFDNSSNWLAGLKASSTYDGKLYGVPYYAGSRVITYRTDLFKKAGFKKPPKSLAQFQRELVKVGKMKKHVKGFSPLYVGGEDWFTALGLSSTTAARSRTSLHGKWVGTLASKKSLSGPQEVQGVLPRDAVEIDGTLDGPNPFPYTVFSQGRTAANYGPAWYTCCTGKKYAKVVGQFVMPSHTKGKPMPGFLGGSDLAVPIQSNSQAQARAWMADFTSTANEKALEKKGNIPNATNLLGKTRERAGCRAQLVRPAGEALGRRPDRQHPEDVPRPVPHRPSHGQAGRAGGRPEHRANSQPVLGRS